MPRDNEYAFSCAVVATMTPLLIGYNIGATDGATVYLKELETSETEIEVVTAILSILSIVGMAMAGRTADIVGRRLAILMAGLAFLFGRFLIGTSRSYAVLLGGRLIASVGVGSALMITAIYIAEVSPASSRGRLCSLPEVFFNVGMVLGRTLNYVSSKAELNLGWRIVLSLATITSHILAIGILAMPESPRWLVMVGRLNKARQVLSIISDSDEEAALRLAEIKRAAGIPADRHDDILEVNWQSTVGMAWRDLLLHPTWRVIHILVCVVAMHSFRQASGVDILLHRPQFFKNADITESKKKLLANIVVDLVKTLCMLYPTFHLDRTGRRPLMLFSIGGMVSSLLVLGTFLIFVDPSDTEHTWVVGVCIALVLLYLAFFSVGLGPITSIYSSEVFPLRLRAQGSAIGFAMNQAVTEVSSMSFLWLCETITDAGAAFLLVMIACAMWMLFYIMMAETRGLTLEEIQRIFGNYIERRPTARVMEQPRIDNGATMLRPPSRAIINPSRRDVN